MTPVGVSHTKGYDGVSCGVVLCLQCAYGPETLVHVDSKSSGQIFLDQGEDHISRLKYTGLSSSKICSFKSLDFILLVFIFDM